MMRSGSASHNKFTRHLPKPAQAGVRIFCELLQEIVMPFSGKWPPSSFLAVALTSTAVTLLSAHAALASQGPGGGAGTASSFIQQAMAIIVYGTSTLVIGGGLIGAVRRR
jgi:hypothetical protein